MEELTKEAKAHKQGYNVPDLIGMGILKRKLTRKEATKVTNEVMDMNLKDQELRFSMVIIKTINIVNN